MVLFDKNNEEIYVEYLIENEQVPEPVAKEKVKKFLQVEETRNSLCDLVTLCRFKKMRKKFLGFVNAYDLTKEPYEMSNFMALCTLYDMVTKGPECGAFKSVVVSALTAAENKEEVKKIVGKVLAEWRPQEQKINR